MCIQNTDKYDELPHDVQQALHKVNVWQKVNDALPLQPQDLFFTPKSSTNGKDAWRKFVEWNAPRGMKKANRVRCRNYWVWRVRNVS
jgi:hypothetical protein